MDNTTTTSGELLRFEGIGKDFGGHVVLDGVNLSVKRGEIVGLVGENGAGKSTLMKILFGMTVIARTGGYRGRIFFEGRETLFDSPFAALDAGIGMVHQEFSLIPGFSGAENIVLNREPQKASVLEGVFGDRMRTLDRAFIRERGQGAMKLLGVNIDPEMVVAEMPVGHKQFTEIAREVARRNVKLLVLDEPTAVLTETEAEILLKALRKLAAEGVGIIFISHRLQEILTVCDRVVVLRDGSLVRDVPVGEASVRQIAEWMVGRPMAEAVRSKAAERTFGEVEIEVERLWVDMAGERVRDVSFKVRKGEIFGLGGLAGQGKLGIPNGIMGLAHAGGNVRIGGRPLSLNEPMTALRASLAFVSEDRRGVGLLLDEPIDWNIGFSAMQVHGRFVRKLLGGLIEWRDDQALAKAAREYVELLDIKCVSARQTPRELSGGNQQKVCLAKAFALEPRVLFVSEPTRGIDIGAKRLVLDALRKANREKGTTIVMISSELEELRSICDRIAIVDEGVIRGELPPDAPVADFGLLMLGATGQGGAHGAG